MFRPLRFALLLASVTALSAVLWAQTTASDSGTADKSAPQPAPQAKHVWTNEDFPEHPSAADSAASGASSGDSSAAASSDQSSTTAAASDKPAASGQSGDSAEVAAAHKKVEHLQLQKKDRQDALKAAQENLANATDDFHRELYQTQIDDLQNLIGQSQKALDSAQQEESAAQAKQGQAQSQDQQQKPQ